MEAAAAVAAAAAAADAAEGATSSRSEPQECAQDRLDAHSNLSINISLFFLFLQLLNKMYKYIT